MLLGLFATEKRNIYLQQMLAFIPGLSQQVPGKYQ
jgi:hypothetical protein